MVVIDTSVIIDHLRQIERQRETKLVQLARNWSKTQLALSTISIQELYLGKSMNDIRNEQQLLAIVSSMTLLPYTLEIAQRAGDLGRQSKTSMEFADLAIAATCLVNQAKLATLNTKHFRSITEIELVD